MRPTAGSAAPVVDVIVPFGNPPGQVEREANLHTVVQRSLRRQDYPQCGVILVEMGPVDTHRQYASVHCDGYVHVPSTGGFSAGAAQNAGFAAPTRRGRLVYFHQADFVIPPGTLSDIVVAFQVLGAPFVYPYWGEVHLSRPLSAAVRAGEVDGDELYGAVHLAVRRARDRSATTWAGRTSESGHVVMDFDPVEVEILRSVVPPPVLDRIDRMGEVELWGVDDRACASFHWPPAEDAQTSSLLRASAGPRASAAYLCTDRGYREVGGVPEFVGWGFEDLTAWLNVQTVYDYTADLHAVRWRDKDVTLGLPLVHLWHPVGGQPEYYGKAAENESSYRRLTRLTRAERLRTIRPLGQSGG